ncbi:MAG: hypothetical protein ABI158_05815 [Edaphobacter sp.]
MPVFAAAQSQSSSSSGEDLTQPLPDESEQIPDLYSFTVPVHGINAGLSVLGVHDSAIGWATIATPFVSYSFNPKFSADVTLPVYMYRLAENISPHPSPEDHLVALRGKPADMIFGLHAQFFPALARYEVTASITAPTGDQEYGLSTGQVTFDINNHFERTFSRFTPKLELGMGDSSTLVNRTVAKHYTSLGPLAHFQAGFIVDLVHGTSFESDAYEQLPLGDQKIYGYSRRRRATVIKGRNVSEDNGFINSLDIPLNRHVTLFVYYSHSLRLRTDTAAIGINLILRGPTQIDDFLFDDLF